MQAGCQKYAGRREGLIVNIGYFGSQCYWNNVAYGICKAAVDKLTADAAQDLKPYGVTTLSLYPGTASTEGMLAFAALNPDIDVAAMETPLFSGRCIAALATDPHILERTGGVCIAAEVAMQYGIRDVDGKQPVSERLKYWGVNTPAPSRADV